MAVSTEVIAAAELVVASTRRSARTRGGRSRDYSELLEGLAAGIAEITTSEQWARYLDVQSKFYRYSPNNAILIMMQNPYATRVAGYKRWAELGRHVKRQESALRILAPMTYTKEDGVEGEQVREIRGFKLVPVFDISQTEGPDLPEIATKLQGLAPEGVFEKLVTFAQSIGFRVERPEALDSGANGDTTHAQGLIRVVASNSPAQQTKTLAHEIGHALLHDPESPTTKDVERGRKELEAESTAYVICTALGMDTSDYSFGYVAGWAGGGAEAIAGVKESAGRIQKASTAVLKMFETEEPLVEVASERGIEMKTPQLVPHDGREVRETEPDAESRPRRGDRLGEGPVEGETADRLVRESGVTEVNVSDTFLDGEPVRNYQPLSSSELEGSRWVLLRQPRR